MQIARPPLRCAGTPLRSRREHHQTMQAPASAYNMLVVQAPDLGLAHSFRNVALAMQDTPDIDEIVALDVEDVV
jgi:hypothetical protein